MEPTRTKEDLKSQIDLMRQTIELKDKLIELQEKRIVELEEGLKWWWYIFMIMTQE